MTIPPPTPPSRAGPPLAPLPPLSPQPPLMVSYASAPMPQIPSDWTTVEIFALQPEALGPFLRILILTQIVIRLLLTGTLFAVIAFMSVYRSAWDWIIFGGIFGGISLILSSFRIFRTVQKQKRLWQFFRLVVADQGIIQYYADRPQLLVRRADIRRITEGHDSFRLQLGVTSLTISKRVESPNRVRERLAQYMPIQPGKGLLGLSAAIAWTYALAIASIACYMTGLFTNRRSVLISCLAVTIILAIITIFRTLRERAHTPATRIQSILGLIGPAMLIARLFLLPPTR